MPRFWLWLCRFAYRRLRQRTAYRDLPHGIPGVRDPDHPCPIYAPRKRELGDWSTCQGDGHYLCQECALLQRDEADEEGAVR